jgi:cyclopropane-fatty-acyl-phospholipid synthase
MVVSRTDELGSTAWASAPRGGGVAEVAAPLVKTAMGESLPVRIEFWDGTDLGPAEGAEVLRVRSVKALRRMIWSPDELGIARAYVAGDLDVEGDMFAVFAGLRDGLRIEGRLSWRMVLPALVATGRLGALGWPLSPPVEEVRMRGRRHSRRRDARVIGYHYDVGNEFYRLVLGEAMTYSCARFVEPGMSLAEAQKAKHELICRKLGLHERSGGRLLDVGCGWGSLAIHAAAQYGMSVVGITISEAQAALARRRVSDLGLGSRVEIRVQDYRDLRGETFDAVASVGMSEHVGAKNTAGYFATLRSVLGPGGRLLNHAISAPGGSKVGGDRSFMRRYVFPDGELLDVAAVAAAMEKAGFELRDVESLREHYALTLRAWVANLEANWDRAEALVGAARARIWRLYMVGAALGFDAGRIAIHQVLGVVPDRTGTAGMPATRRNWQ